MFRLNIVAKRPFKKPKNDADEDVEGVDIDNKEVNISWRRLKKLKRRLKYLLYYHEKESISKKDNDVPAITEKEVRTCSLLYDFLDLHIPKKKEANLITTQLPMLVLANKIFEATGYKKRIMKLCPKPTSSSPLCLPLDTALFYSLLTNFGEHNFDLTCKDGVRISSDPSAL
ncbi:hypothetical protein K501DRAFT_279014 [Backusella circina FSU 941]|nr:hypothetical protein K501DRAFT_279014 [Backusella circina FSU 941]